MMKDEIWLLNIHVWSELAITLNCFQIKLFIDDER